MLVKNWLKRGLSVIISTAMLVMMLTSVTALADNNYEITDNVFTDTMKDTSNMYSYSDGQTGWGVVKRTTTTDRTGYVAGYEGQEKTWTVPVDNINVCYKAGGGKKFTEVTFYIWINNDVWKNNLYPIIKVKADAASASEFETVSDAAWTSVQYDGEGTGWYRLAKCTVYCPEGVDMARFEFRKGVEANMTILHKAEFKLGCEAEKFYDDCSSLDNVFLTKNLQVISDVVGSGEYNNGGHMIGLQTEADYEAIYKIPEGRSLKSLWLEYSVQDNVQPNIAVSADGKNFNECTVSRKEHGKAGTAGDAQWADVTTIDYTPTENNVRFIKIYGNARTYQFYIRKVCIMTAGGEIDSYVVNDDLSGTAADMYEVSNFVPYISINKTEAGQLADTTNTLTFHDSDMLAVKDVNKEAYIIYKAAEGRTFTDVDVTQLTRDEGVPVTISASKDGIKYDEITNIESDLNFIGVGNTIDAGWNKKFKKTATLNQADGYSYVKLSLDIVSEGVPMIKNSKCLKLSSVSLKTANALSLYKKDGEVETNLNGKPESGNLFAKVSYTPKDGETKMYAIIALKEGDRLINAAVNSYDNATGTTEFVTPVLANCTINANTVVEVYLWNVTDNNLVPVMEKAMF